MISETITTRFAPSPTGALHPGNLRTALFSFLLARAAGGRFIVRIEDTDRERDREDQVGALLADLAWLGIDWDAGPDRPDPAGPYRQSERGAIYARQLERLQREGQAYPCYCTPAELEAERRSQAAAARPPRYSGRCRDLDSGERAAREREGRRPALRFRVPEGGHVQFHDRVRGEQRIATESIGDFPVRRSDGGAVFFFCNAVDDALMGVTDVLRGDDHLSNTPRQLLLLRALGLPEPRYGHLPLLLDAGGAPQSKRRGSVTIGELRGRGYLPGAVANYLLRLGHHGAPDGWIEPREFPRQFAADRLGRAPAHYDPAQLDHWQREAIARLTTDQAADWLGTALPVEWNGDARRRTAELLRGNVLLPADVGAWLPVLGGNLAPLAAEDRALLAEAGSDYFEAALAAYAESGPDFGRLAGELQRRTGRKGRALFMPLRLALTGRHDGPELAALLPALPRELVHARLERAARAR